LELLDICSGNKSQAIEDYTQNATAKLKRYLVYGCVGMSILGGLTLNWVQYQFSHGIVLSHNSNANVCLAVAFSFGIVRNN
jgi:hypothetical protein